MLAVVSDALLLMPGVFQHVAAACSKLAAGAGRPPCGYRKYSLGGAAWHLSSIRGPLLRILIDAHRGANDSHVGPLCGKCPPGFAQDMDN